MHSRGPLIVSTMLIVLLLLLVCTFNNVHAQLGPGNKSGSCNFVWKNRFYVLGGTPDPDSYGSSNFSYTNFPIDTTSTTQWHDLKFNQMANYNPKGTWNLDAWPCLVSPSNFIVVGGYSMIGYDLVNDQWVPINVTGNPPPQSLQASTNVRFTNMGDSFIIFDGYTGSGLQAPPNADYYIFNSTTWSWKAGPVNLPTPNYDSSQLAYAAGQVYMLGGSVNTSIGQGVYYRNIYKFNLVTQAWTSTAHQLDLGLDWPSVANWEDQKVFIFGGGTEESIAVNPTQLSKDVRLLNIADETVSLLNPLQQGNQSVAPPPMITGKLAIHSDCLIVFGGSIGPYYNRTKIGKIFVFNFTIPDWVPTAAAVYTVNSTTSLASSASLTSSSMSSSSPTAPGGKDQGPSPIGPGPIAGAIVGVVVVVAVVGFLIYRRRRMRGVPRNRSTSIPGGAGVVFKPMDPGYEVIPPPLKPDETSHVLTPLETPNPPYPSYKPDVV